MFLYQDAEGFLFNSDAHFLYDFISAFKPSGSLLDVGAGCGIVGLLCKRDFPVDVTLIEKQSSQASLIEHNARVNALKVEVICDDFLSHDFGATFDFVVSNPPYYHEGADKSVNPALRTAKSADALPFSQMVVKVNRIIKPKGRFIFCYDAKQLPQLLWMLAEAKFTVTDMRFVHGTAAKPAKLVMLCAQKGSRALCRIHPPLIHFEGEKMREEAQNVYRKTRTYSIKCKLL